LDGLIDCVQHQVGGTAEKMFLSRHGESESDDDWNRDEPEGEDGKCYSTLRRVMESRCSEEQRFALEQSSIKFQEAVRHTLNMLHVFTE
jgi:hypothetical protein